MISSLCNWLYIGNEVFFCFFRRALPYKIVTNGNKTPKPKPLRHFIVLEILIKAWCVKVRNVSIWSFEISLFTNKHNFKPRLQDRKIGYGPVITCGLPIDFCGRKTKERGRVWTSFLTLTLACGIISLISVMRTTLVSY